MSLYRCLSYSILLVATPALAGPDLAVSISGGGGYVYDLTRYEVNVRNAGNKNAASATLTIELPATATSPVVHILGDLASFDPRCTRTGTNLSCAVPALRKGKSTAFALEIALPQAARPLVLAARVAGSADSNPANDSASVTAALSNHAVSLSAPQALHNRHCTGQGLSSFFECALYPSSISEHDVVLEIDGSLRIVGEPSYSGRWWQPSATRLQMEYTSNGVVVAEFDGYGVDANCFEGRTTFPNSAYVAIYEVCR